MTFIFGGAYQGQEEYARDALGAGEVFAMSEGDECFDVSKKAITGLDAFVLGCIRRGVSAAEVFKKQADELADAVLIGSDFSSGLVPMDAETRLRREENGRLNNAIAARADHVIRMFCGLPQIIK